MLFHLFVLGVVQNSLEKFLKLILSHNSLGHVNEGDTGCVPHILVGIVKVVGQVDNKLVVFFKEQNVVAELLHDVLEALADLEPIHTRTRIHVL